MRVQGCKMWIRAEPCNCGIIVENVKIPWVIYYSHHMLSNFRAELARLSCMIKPLQIFIQFPCGVPQSSFLPLFFPSTHKLLFLRSKYRNCWRWWWVTLAWNYLAIFWRKTIRQKSLCISSLNAKCVKVVTLKYSLIQLWECKIPFTSLCLI